MKRMSWLGCFLSLFGLGFLWHAVGGFGLQDGKGATLSAGDSNGDGRLDISDPVHTLNYLFGSGPAPAVCQGGPGTSAADVSFDPEGSALGSVTVQGALLEVDQRQQNLATSNSSLTSRVAALEGSVEIELVSIPAGSFTMGSPPTEAGRRDDETEHVVHISKAFFLGAKEITQEQFHAVMGWNPSLFSGCPDCPVENENWYDAKEFCRRLTDQHRSNATISESSFYRLPTEAEWEYACRAGTTTVFYFGDAVGCGQQGACAILDEHMWWAGNNTTANYGPKPVAMKPPNPWGLYDMYGNVSEWCQDLAGPYPEGEVTDPTGATEGRSRIDRGGSYELGLGFQRSAGWRFQYLPELRNNAIPTGIRVVLEVTE